MRKSKFIEQNRGQVLNLESTHNSRLGLRPGFLDIPLGGEELESFKGSEKWTG